MEQPSVPPISTTKRDPTRFYGLALIRLSGVGQLLLLQLFAFRNIRITPSLPFAQAFLAYAHRIHIGFTPSS